MIVTLSLLECNIYSRTPAIFFLMFCYNGSLRDDMIPESDNFEEEHRAPGSIAVRRYQRNGAQARISATTLSLVDAHRLGETEQQRAESRKTTDHRTRRKVR
jgi:hypothetical protein